MAQLAPPSSFSTLAPRFTADCRPKSWKLIVSVDLEPTPTVSKAALMIHLTHIAGVLWSGELNLSSRWCCAYKCRQSRLFRLTPQHPECEKRSAARKPAVTFWRSCSNSSKGSSSHFLRAVHGCHSRRSWPIPPRIAPFATRYNNIYLTFRIFHMAHIKARSQRCFSPK